MKGEGRSWGNLIWFNDAWCSGEDDGLGYEDTGGKGWDRKDGAGDGERAYPW